MKLTIAITCYGQNKYLDECLASIPAGVDGLNGGYEIVVLDNKESGELIYESWNHAWNTAQGTYVGIFNDDIVFGYRSLTLCVAAMEKDENLWCCYPCHTRHDKPSDFAGRAKQLAHDKGRELQGPPEFRGFAFLLAPHCKKLEERPLMLFDEGYFLYCGDDDFMIRLRQVGHGAREVAGALVHHYQCKSTHTRMIEEPGWDRQRNLYLSADLHRKHAKFSEWIEPGQGRCPACRRAL